ncbi:MAG: hypothetical protein RIS47_1290 [Bacteroidota bacterium]
MLHTYNATYEDGRIIQTDIPKRIRKAKVLITIIEEETQDWFPLLATDLSCFENAITLSIDPLSFQKQIRDEW